MIEDILLPVVSLGGLGLIFGSGLAVASKVFAVKVDPKIESIRAALPGANCGACGYPGCDAFSKAVSLEEAPVNGCPVGGLETAEKIGEIMGKSAGSSEKKVARVICNGTTCNTKEKFEYNGIQDCKAAALVQGGSKSCEYGCLGLGTCYDVCDFDAIKIEDGIAHIDPEKCTACGKCLEACPKNIIKWTPYDQNVVVDCNNNEFGKDVKVKCTTGCIGCKICVKACPFDAMEFEDNLARINYDKCTNCMICAEKCPTNAIWADFEKRKTAEVIEDKCIGCTICAKNCPVDAIDGEVKKVHEVDPEKCIGCGVCEEKCPKDAIKLN
ncbi:RnfABCDGE type electron transport complex subunit B [Clostridium sp. D2Q-14]|uniref:RnfABCDGE type electron transport complex subunit B n=1 Tax=Anaeromonas gelatinilytica TaxID=2683194 RepID=UPI00193AF8BC|nr:RnfABCDGE type electron transport complex subunit B [Anaeromonas gelatinilytica]MBS4535947.1 RnfABCDGE type electron transport complex subunit B [Anaeromonas gelatinilytica]